MKPLGKCRRSTRGTCRPIICFAVVLCWVCWILWWQPFLEIVCSAFFCFCGAGGVVYILVPFHTGNGRRWRGGRRGAVHGPEGLRAAARLPAPFCPNSGRHPRRPMPEVAAVDAEAGVATFPTAIAHTMTLSSAQLFRVHSCVCMCVRMHTFHVFFPRNFAHLLRIFFSNFSKIRNFLNHFSHFFEHFSPFFLALFSILVHFFCVLPNF